MYFRIDQFYKVDWNYSKDADSVIKRLKSFGLSFGYPNSSNRNGWV